MTAWRVPYVGNYWEELIDFDGRPDRIYLYTACSQVTLVTHRTSFRVRAATQAEHEGALA